MFDAIVVAGGSARRLDGADKPAVEIDGVSLLDRVLAAVTDADRVIVVGPTRATIRTVQWVGEDPPGGGPVAAIDAAIDHVRAPWCLVLAADLPWIGAAVPLLLAAAGAGAEPDIGTSNADAAVLSTAGRQNFLAAAWRTEALRAALAALDAVANAAARNLYRDVRVSDVPDTGGWGHDCDTWADVQQARARQDVQT